MKKLVFIVCAILLTSVVNAQTKQIKGTVTGADDGIGIPGVSVSIKGTTQGTSTDLDGNYSLNVKSTDVLIFSFVGMISQEISVGDQNIIDVVMQQESIGVDEVVVTGYASHRKSEVTGSVVQVGGDELSNIPVVAVDQALQGKVAGVVINSVSGTPGQGQEIRIRGRSSITASNSPLFVIDGVPVVNSSIGGGSDSSNPSTSQLSMLSTLNSNDIESMTILKDAAATAAYGARGANGVIIITTKSGKAGKSVINFSARYGVSNDAIDGPRVLTGAEREELYKEAVFNTYGEDYGWSSMIDAVGFADPYGYGAVYENWNENGAEVYDWADVITNKDARFQEYNLSARGGSKDITYFVSGGYLKQEGTVIGSEFERFSGTVNLDAKLSKKLRLSTKNSASHAYQDGLLEESAYFSSPRAAKYFMSPLNAIYNEDGSYNMNTTGNPNPLYIAENDIDENYLTRIMTNNTLIWDTPIENLTFSTKMSIDYQVTRYKTYNNPNLGDGAEVDGEGYVESQNRANYVFQNMLTYDWNIDDIHKFNFKVIQEYQKNRLFELNASGESFTTEGLTNLNSAGSPTGADSWFTDWSIASYLGLIHYSYQDKYVLDFTYRREGSSRFSADNRWGNFYAVGGAWNMNRENFLSENDWLDMLKLRASYGVTGNANIDLNTYQRLLGFAADYNGEGAAYPSTVGSSTLSWEKSNSLDVGVDFGFLRNRIAGSVGYYHRTTYDMLQEVPLSQTTGFEDQNQNIGDMVNKGFEFELSLDIIRSNDLNLSLSANLATNDNEVTKLAKDANGDQINITTSTRRIEEGHPVYGWNMRTWAGVNSETGEETWYLNGVDGETTTKYNDAEAVWQGGSAIPTLTGGLSLHVDYKGFFLDASAYYAGGHKVYEDWTRYTNGTDLYTVGAYQGVSSILDRWQKPGDTGNRFGKFEYTFRPWMSHSKFLYDGDYIRLKDLTLGYTFNDKILESMKLGGLSVYVKGTNLLTWAKDSNLKYDPEIDATGFTDLRTPPTKSIIIGVNLKF